MASIIHASTGKEIVITSFHNDLFTILNTGLKGKQTMATKTVALVASKYGAPGLGEMPTYDAYVNDCDALAKLMTDKGLSKESDHFMRAYREALITLYKALPVSMEADARRKYEARLEPAQKVVYEKAVKEACATGAPERIAVAQAVRAVKSVKKQVKQATPGAPAGEKKDQAVTPQVHFEQMIASLGAHGIFIAIDAVVAILRADKATEDKAKAFTQLRNNLAKELKLADATPALKTGTNG